MANGMASADVIFTVQNANFAGSGGGGSLTGTVTLNNALTSVTAANLTATPKIISGFTFPGFNYTLGSSSVSSESSTLIQFDSTSPGYELRLNFTSALTSSGAMLATSSYESEPGAGNRTLLTGGSLVPAASVPEPSSIVTMSVMAVLGTGGYWFRRKRAA